MASRVRWAIVSRLWLAMLLGCLPAAASLIFPGPKFPRPPGDSQGSAAAAATVTVDAQSAYRHGNFYRAQLPVNNSTGPVSVAVTTTAVEHQGGVLPDLVATTGGHYFLPQTPEVYTYDLDGNLLTDGRWRYTWDGENHLVSLQPLSVAAGNQTLNFEYDRVGRRIRKTVRTITGSSSTITADTKFVYDGWNLIAELNAADNTVLCSYVWGPDLSGTLQGAGGVGGLLVARPGSGMAAQFACYDGNGNITAYVDAGTGLAASQFEYGPFGEVIRATGPLAKLNPFLFSTHYYEWETGLYYSKGRYYDPIPGRFLSRDPIEEKGGLNLYGYCANDGINKVDPLGLDGWGMSGPGWSFQYQNGQWVYVPSGSTPGFDLSGAGWRVAWILETGGTYRELYVAEAGELNKLRGQISKEQLIALRNALKDKYQSKTPPEVENALKAAVGSKYEKRGPTGNFNPDKTNPFINKSGAVCKRVGRVFVVVMAYSEYQKIKNANDWQRQLGSSGSGVVGAITGGTEVGAATGAALGALEFNPLTVGIGTVIGGAVGGVFGYDFFSGTYEQLWDILYEKP